MTRGVLITEDQLKAAWEYMEEMYAAMDDPTLTEDARNAACFIWRGARRVLRRLGIRSSELDEMFLEKEVKTA